MSDTVTVLFETRDDTVQRSRGFRRLLLRMQEIAPDESGGLPIFRASRGTVAIDVDRAVVPHFTLWCEHNDRLVACFDWTMATVPDPVTRRRQVIYSPMYLAEQERKRLNPDPGPRIPTQPWRAGRRRSPY
jgi:hypothetical protein